MSVLAVLLLAVGALLVAGLAAVQLSTGNLLVRLVLVSTGAMDAYPAGRHPEKELRGGRLLALSAVVVGR